MTVLTTLTVKVPLLVLIFIVSGCGTVNGIAGTVNGIASDVSKLSSSEDEEEFKYTTAEDLAMEESAYETDTAMNTTNNNAGYQQQQPAYQQPAYHQPVYQQPAMMSYPVAAPVTYGYPVGYAAPAPQYYAPQPQQYYAPQVQYQQSYQGYGDRRYYSR